MSNPAPRVVDDPAAVDVVEQVSAMFDSGNREDAVDDHVVERVDFAFYTENL